MAPRRLPHRAPPRAGHRVCGRSAAQRKTGRGCGFRRPALRGGTSGRCNPAPTLNAQGPARGPAAPPTKHRQPLFSTAGAGAARTNCSILLPRDQKTGLFAMSRCRLPAARLRLTAICVTCAVRPWAVSAATASCKVSSAMALMQNLASGFAASAASTTARRLPLLPPIKQRPARASLPVRREQSPR